MLRYDILSTVEKHIVGFLSRGRRDRKWEHHAGVWSGRHILHILHCYGALAFLSQWKR